MPEGDIVLRAAQRLQQALAGRVLITSDFRWPSLATTSLVGREVLEVEARGKHMLMRVGGGVTIHSHLRMEGSWHVHRTGEPWRQARAEHGIRLVLANDTWTAIGHRLGMLDLVATSAEDQLVGHLGLDILKPEWDEHVAAALVREHPRRTIGETLLDQRVITGIGTFFMAETCFLRGLNPWTPVADVSQLETLLDRAHKLMSLAVDSGVQVTTGNARPGQEQWVHARSGRPCRRCGTAIRVARLGEPPNDRVAFWCPFCQPGVVPTDAGAPQQPLGANRRPKAPRSQAPRSPTYRRGR